MRSKFSHSRIQQQLATLYGLLLIALAFLLLVIITPLMTRLLNESSQETVSQLAITINTQVDEYLRGMDQLTRQVIYSDEIVNSVLRPYDEDSGLLMPLDQRRSISNDLYSILAPTISRYNQISILNTRSGNYICAGTSSFQTVRAIREISGYEWVQETLAANGKMCIIPPHVEQWGSNSGRMIFSVARAFKNYSSDNDYVGIVEVPCDDQVLKDLFGSALLENNFVEKIFCFAPDGSVIYASHASEATSYREMLPTLSDPNAHERQHHQLMAYAQSDLSHWQIVIQADQSLINSPISNVIYTIVLTIIIAAICAMMMSYYFSRQLSKPIQQIYQSINHLQISKHSVSLHPPATNTGNELELLRDSFDQLCSQLDQAVNEAATARTCELESRMMALESQINPHFLYNTFAMIQTMADSNGNSDISMISSALSTLLRYSVATSNTPVTIGSEMEACSLYLRIMYQRHCTQLSYTISMDSQLEKCPVPRMILQPLLENCFKHGFKNSDQWILDVQAVQDEESWYITIRDNGVGFSPDVINHIRLAVECKELVPYLDEAGDKHIGLVNVGLRMKFFFGDDLIFDIENLPEGGSLIRLGSKKGMRYE